MELEEILPLKEKYLDELKAIAELEKQNGILAHQLKYAGTILTDVQADKFKLREKLKIAEEALKFISQNSSCSHMEDTADKALEKIEATR